MKTSVGYAMDYIIGLGLFGLIWGILNLIYVPLTALKSPGDLLTIANVMWTGSLVVYLVFGAFWLPRKIKEWEYYNGSR